MPDHRRDSGNWRTDRVGSAERGENPMVLARMPSGFAVIGDTQFLPGYCLLLASPSVNHLSDLPLPRRIDFLRDMSVLGEAVEAACTGNGLRRINYEILGNSDTWLHAHVFPRYDWEPEALRRRPAFNYPEDRWSDQQYAYDKNHHGELRAAITTHLRSLMRHHGIDTENR